MPKQILSILLIYFSFIVNAQDSIIYSSPMLKEVVITGINKDFNADYFMELVMNDTSFNNAFRNIRQVKYTSDINATFFNKKNIEKASYSTIANQSFQNNNCRYLSLNNETVTGNYFNKKREDNYKTAELFSEIFLYPDTVCQSVSNNPTKGNSKNDSRMRQLLFSPGQEVNIPIIGKKMEIFSPEMQEYYSYNIYIENFKGKDCYVFEVEVLPQFKADKTVIKSLKTYFIKDNFQVVYRSYNMKYNSTLFDFNVYFRFLLKNHNNKQYLEELDYNGFWKIPLKKAEIAKFNTRFNY